MLRSRADEPLEKADEAWLARAEGPLVLSMGRLVPQKGQWHLIRAFKHVVQEVPDARLMLLGVGRLHDALIRVLSDADVRERYKQAGPRRAANFAPQAVLAQWEGILLRP